MIIFHICKSIVDIVKDILNIGFYYLVNTFKKYAPTIPHLAIVHAKCVIINMEMSFLIRVKIVQDTHNFFPVLENLNGSFAVLPSSLSRNKDFCHFETRVYDNRDNSLFEMRKFTWLVGFNLFTNIYM